MNRASFALACIAVGASASVSLGNCPDFERPATFDVLKYTGTWYEIKKDKLNLYELDSACVTANYSPNEDGTIKVYNRDFKVTTGKYGDITGKAVESTIDGPGSLVVSFFDEPSPDSHGNYNVLETDYETYAIFYDCAESRSFGMIVRNESYAILGRTETLPKDLLATLEARTKEIIPSYDYDTNVIDTP
eukprot:CAMPEP_0170466082 /NCGR_PEP_ID=MMETSP0123-20130129/10183_1 /TAXON_ID=182087 /ORGANISM="Favella ehrenbergii, Strain Fehren 1" /LENGTH=189 /DNA_ID=CAMNT_0010732137 /DNA_START=39 /DNA_END=608 /DNA_ORIENTATION=+